MERTSVTFVQLGDRTHVAVHSIVQFPAEPARPIIGALIPPGTSASTAS